MRKKIIVAIVAALTFISVGSATAEEVSNGHESVGSTSVSTNGVTDAVSWSNCTGQDGHSYVSVKRKSADWSVPILVGGTECGVWPQVAVLNNGTIYVFWLESSKLYFSKSGKTGNTFTEPALLPATQSKNLLEVYVFSNQNAITLFTTSLVDENLFGDTYDLVGKKWHANEVGDLFPDSVFTKCDYSDENCEQNVNGAILKSNAKGQQVLLMTVVSRLQQESLETYAAYVFKRSSGTKVWNSRAILDSYGPADVYSWNFWPTSVVVTPKGKSVIAFNRQFNTEPNSIETYTSSSMNKAFKRTDELAISSLTNTSDGHLVNQGEKVYLAFSAWEDLYANNRSLYGKVSDLDHAAVLSDSLRVLDIGMVGGKVKAILATNTETMDGYVYVSTKKPSGWSNPVTVISPSVEHVKPMTFWISSEYRNAHAVIATVGFYDDGISSFWGKGIYAESIK